METTTRKPTRPIRAATQKQVDALIAAVWHLRQARDLLVDSDCPKTLQRLRRVLTSAGGAERHIRHRFRRTENRELLHGFPVSHKPAVACVWCGEADCRQRRKHKAQFERHYVPRRWRKNP